jgi:ubiquinone/menaquinone biosynthesis C-methylase UbiE
VTSSTGPSPNYDGVAWLYDAVARLYSFNQIRRSKFATLKYVEPGDRVLFLGAGAGEEAARAAAHGALVTCIDVSQAMLDRTRRRLEKGGARAELIAGDALAHDRFGAYDAVVGNFFFNLFSIDRMPVLLAHAVKLIGPGGRLMIADLAPASGGLAARSFNRFYARLGMVPFWLLGLVAWHPTYDYRGPLSRLGLEEEAVEDFRLFRHGPVMFRTIVARKTEGR